MVGGWLAEELQDKVDPALPMVAIGHNTARPWVDYDWDYEVRRAIGCLEARGARHIWVLGGQDPCGPHLRTDVEVIWRRLAPANTGRQLMSAAYAATRETLETEPDIDGIVATDDFNGQGMFDALARLGNRARGDLRLLCMINRHSRISTTIPYQRLVADGYLKGREIARLFDQCVQEPAAAAAQVTLGCSLETPAALLP